VEQTGSQNIENCRDGGGCVRQHQSQEPPSGAGRSIRPSTTVPPTVLMTELDNGALILQGRPDGPRVRMSLADAMPLRRELAAAFGRAEPALRNGQSETR
jgi:hypothetical protein